MNQKRRVPNLNEVDHPFTPPFKVVQMSDGDYGVWDEEHVIVEDIPFRNKENAEWICDALNAYLFKDYMKCECLVGDNKNCAYCESFK